MDCKSPSETVSPEATQTKTQSLDVSSFPLGTAWDRLNEQDLQACVEGAPIWNRVNRLTARGFRLSNVTEITTKLTASLELGAKVSVITASLKAAIEQEFQTTSTNEVYVIVTTLIDQEGVVSFPSLNPTSLCPSPPSGGLQTFIDNCGSDYIARVVHGGYAFIWVNAATLPANLSEIREKLGHLDQSIEVDAEQLLTDLEPLGTNFNVYSTLGAPTGTATVLSTTDLLTYFNDQLATANASPVGTPAFPRLETELSRPRLDAIEACVGPTGLSEDQWECLHGSLARFSDIARETDYGRRVYQVYLDALAVLETLNTVNEQAYIFPTTSQALCDSVGASDDDGNPNTEECGREIYEFVAANFSDCRALSISKLSECINAAASGAQCDRVENIYPQECRLSAGCETFLSVIDQVPPPDDRGNRPPDPPNANFRPNRTYSFRSASNAQTIPLEGEDSASTLCFLTGFNGLFDNQFNYARVSEANGFWQADFRTSTAGSDPANLAMIQIECVDKSRFSGRQFWQQGSYSNTCFGGNTCTVPLFGMLLPSPRESVQSYLALNEFGGRWQHWEDRFYPVNSNSSSVPRLQGFWEFVAVSGDGKTAGVHWFAAEPSINHPTSTAFPLITGSLPVQTAGVPVPVLGRQLPVLATDGICFLNGVQGEFVRSVDSVNVSVSPTGFYAVSVNSGWNTVDRRDVWARAQCVLYQ